MLNFLLRIHSLNATLVLVAGALTLLCGIAYYFMRRRAAGSATGTGTGGEAGQPVRRVFRALLGVTAALGVLQAVLGVLLVTQGCSPREGLHYVYGIIVLGAIPVAFVYSDQKDVRRDIIIMSIAAAAIVGAAIRGFATGPGGICH